MRALVALVCCAAVTGGVALAACGGSTSSIAPGDGGARDGISSADGPTGSEGGDAASTDSSASVDADGGSAVEAGPPCAAPTDPSKSALCLDVVPETIAFTSDPRFDGKGLMVAEVFDTNIPDLPDGGSVTPLAAVSLPGDGGTLDLSQPIPPIRFDGLPTAVYARVLFTDNPQPNAQVGAGFC